PQASRSSGMFHGRLHSILLGHAARVEARGGGAGATAKRVCAPRATRRPTASTPSSRTRLRAARRRRHQAERTAMARIDFNKVGDAGPLPDGQYLCKIERVERSQTQYGDEMWKVRFLAGGGGAPRAGGRAREGEDRAMTRHLDLTPAECDLCGRLTFW